VCFSDTDFADGLDAPANRRTPAAADTDETFRSFDTVDE
jgi:hypothetical protein